MHAPLICPASGKRGGAVVQGWRWRRRGSGGGDGESGTGGVGVDKIGDGWELVRVVVEGVEVAKLVVEGWRRRVRAWDRMLMEVQGWLRLRSALHHQWWGSE